MAPPDENNGHGPDPSLPVPASGDPGNSEVVEPTDALLLRVQDITSAVVGFYEMIANEKPEVIEEFFTKYPKAAAAKLRVAPVVISRILPAQKTITRKNDKPKKAIPVAKLQGQSEDQLKQLAGLEDKDA